MTELSRREAIFTAAAVAVPAGASAEAGAAASELEARVGRAEDAVAVENLMGLYPPLMHAGLYGEILSRFAFERGDASFQIRGVGTWRGLDVRKPVVLAPERQDRQFAAALAKQFPNLWFEPRAGRQFEMPLASPVIHVAGDAQTAKGLWSAWGAQTGVGPDGKVAAFWVAERYAVDFVKEGGAWKFWHFQVVPVFRTLYEESWAEPERSASSNLYSGVLRPSRPSAASRHVFDPPPPQPYATFARTWSY